MKLVTIARLIVAVSVVTLLGLGAAPAAPPAGAEPSDLPLGRPSLPEVRDTRSVAPGVTYTRIERGFGSPRDFYTVDVAFTSKRRDAKMTTRRLRDDGFGARVERVLERAPDDPKSGPLGWLVRVERFSTSEIAEARRAELVADGYSTARVVHTSEDGGKTTGPWVVHVLTVEPAVFDGLLAPELATEIVPERELLSSMAARTEAVASINA